MLRARRVPGAQVVEGPGCVAAFTNGDGPDLTRKHAANLSLLSCDDPGEVKATRDWAAGLAGVSGEHPADRIAWGRQVHATDVALVAAPTAEAIPATDALVTATPGVGVLVLTADCVPTFVAGDGAIAVIHSGWRGLSTGVVDRAVELLREHSGSGPLQAAVGPAIGPCCYEVGTEVADVFSSWPSVIVDVGADRPHLDLRSGVAWRLRENGVDDILPLFPCTRCDPAYFSHRRGDSGRQGVVASLLAGAS